MAEPQSVILPENSAHALFLTFAIRHDAYEEVRSAAAGFPALVSLVASLDTSAGLLGGIGVGSLAWDRLFPGERPGQLHPFVPLSSHGHEAPSTLADLFVHIRSARHDLNLEVAREFRKALGDSVSGIEEVHGYRYLDSRDLTGFVDGTENPCGKHRAEVALVADGDAFRGGSYVSIQRYRHNLEHWDQQPVENQEDVFGRTKFENIEYPSADKPPGAHTRRTSLRDGDTKLEILRQSLPCGASDQPGLYFVAYGSSPKAFETMLESMICGDEQGHCDQLLDYTRAVTGANFFMPSIDFLVSHA